MKIKTVLVAGLAGGIGYVLGTRAGQGRYEEIKAQADRLAHSPQVQETVSNLAEGVRKGAAKLPDPVADVVTSVADLATGSGSKDDVTAAAKGAASSAASAASDAAAGLKDKAGDAADSVKDKAGDAADSAKDKASSAADQASSSDDDFAATEAVVVTPVVVDPDLDALDLETLDELTAPDVTTPSFDTDLGTTGLGSDVDDLGDDPTPRRAE
jgi:uncharacterized phage infection (PIP) family protein YhgE